MSRQYDKNSMLKSKGILYFPPVKEFEEAFKIFNECGGMILSLEKDGFLVDEPLKIAKLYDIPLEHLELYFIDTLKGQKVSDEEIERIITEWRLDEKIQELKF